jgi:hypothetical protein
VFEQPPRTSGPAPRGTFRKHMIGTTVRQARKRRKVHAVDIHAAREVLDRLHRRPTQPVEQWGDEELLQYLTREELQAIVDSPNVLRRGRRRAKNARSGTRGLT